MTHQPPTNAPMLHPTCGPAGEHHVENLFSSIASRYDLINSVLSLGRHKDWRRFAVSLIGPSQGDRALDVCCGTGDFAIELARAVGWQGAVKAIDCSEPMLEIARRKAEQAGLSQIEFIKGDARCLPFADNTFDCAVVGFGLRNIPNFDEAIAEMKRVVRPGGKVLSLEIFGLRGHWCSALWKLYFGTIGPILARILGGNTEAYRYLPQSVEYFATAEQMAREFAAQGLVDVQYRKLALGAVCIHVGTKPLGKTASTSIRLVNRTERTWRDERKRIER
ncbi:MAG: bifunctional demethylmenaquinone methyltransferase/2-methoxy-6-polyprenyl-1,4-benzoquinol methylase UbiE [Armatimonadota bacterium]|nr:bifunctional demethylmenaquinone methyltransferase/2-methoxy-6-polyprenyl-1,4-benzoquinol methylase UbiE [Armatimonadota bacterium]